MPELSRNLSGSHLRNDGDGLPDVVQAQGPGRDAADQDLALGFGQPEDGRDQGRLARPRPADYTNLVDGELA